MNGPPEASVCGFISPLASQLARFLALKHAMGYRYREEGRVLHDLDRFLNTRLSAADPLITPAVVHEYVSRRGSESETTRAHRLTLIREVCRFLRLDDARVVVPDRRSLRIVPKKFVRACSPEMRAAVSCKPVPNCRRGRSLLYGRLFLAPRCVLSTRLGCALENCCDLLRPISISRPAPYVSVTANSTNRGWCRSHRIWSSTLFSAASLQQSATGPVARTYRCSPARGEISIPSPRSAARFMTR